MSEITQIYPICVHTAEDGTLGIIIPDFPGVFSTADSEEQIAEQVHDAILTREPESFPMPSRIEDIQREENYQGGTWYEVALTVDTFGSLIETSLVNPKDKRT